MKKVKSLKINTLNALKIPAFLLLGAVSAVSVCPPPAFAAVETSTSATRSEDENFDKKFREGRDLIDKQEWAKAAEKFSEVINRYPDNKSTDAALYWLAFCYKKQRDFQKMGAAVDRLIKKYPTSSWTNDARVLLVEAATPANVRIITGVAGQNLLNTATQNINRLSVLPSTATVNSSDYYVFNDVFDAGSKLMLDREDEIKIAAFRSLLSADRQKALDALKNILKRDSTSSETLKIEALRTLRRPLGFSGYSISTSGEFSDFASAPAAKSTANEKKPNAPLREFMVNALQENSNPKIRREIIYTLASLKDEASIAKLGEIYQSENDVEVKKAIINSFASSNFAYGNFSVSNISKTAMPSDLRAIAELSSTESTTRAALTDRLLEIIRTEKNPELRLFALNSAQRFGGLSKKEGIADFLSQFYDSATDENFKKSVILSLVKLNQPQATRKLLEIAKNDKSNALRLEAIRALGQSKDPEAIKYLEEIIK